MPLADKIVKQLSPRPDPAIDPVIDAALLAREQQLPTLWLLGKTGAGKSSLVQAVTGDSRATIGNGFSPCTRTAHSYLFPARHPLLRFLDTRGLGEADYCADEDIQTCLSGSHLLLVVMRIDEPEQSALLSALQQIRRSGQIRQLLLVHTAVTQITDNTQRQQCMAHNAEQVKGVWKNDIYQVALDFEPVGEQPEPQPVGLAELKAQLSQLLPITAQLIEDEQHSNLEQQKFAQLKSELLWYCGAAGASDAIPAVGLVSVPAIQARLLHSLASQYHVEWNRRAVSEFIATLGTGFGIQYAGRLGIRQLVKLIPVYGQSVGAASAAMLSFCTTWAIGRTACKYLYHRSRGEPVSEQELQALYRSAFDSIRQVASQETSRET